MSADNYMAIREIDGEWHVWMVLGGYTREAWATPSGPGFHKVFDDELKAHYYAHQVCHDEVVEYGVVTVPEDGDFDMFIDGIGVVED